MNGSSARHASRLDLSRFADVAAWIFDLDNTLYPRSTNLFQAGRRSASGPSSRTFSTCRRTRPSGVQKDYYRRYGTTLRGLMVEHGVAADDFLEFVHDIDHTPIAANPQLATAIAALPGRKFILTNGSLAHAEKVAARLGIPDHFEDIFDIVRLDLLPKPARETYDRFLAATGVAPEQAAMFEDLARNLEAPKALGMVDRSGCAGRRRPAREAAKRGSTRAREGTHVDFVTERSGGFP